MAVYDGFFDAVQNEDTGEYDRAYASEDFTGYFEKVIGSGVCVHNNPDSFKVRLENGKAVVSPGYLFIQGYWCRNDADYPIELPGTGNYAVAAHLNLGKRMIELEAQSVAQAYPDSLVLSIVSPTSAEDTRYNTDICGVIDAAGELSSKVEWAVNYIDNEIEGKLAAAEADINAQSKKLDAKIAEVQAQVDRISPPPIGSIKFSASKDVGAEWLKCDGSFINEADYPELVASLGKLIPSGDKFQLLSDGEIGPQITNGALYGGRLWVYSYSTQKLCGVSVDGSEAIKAIPVSCSDAAFSNLIAPSTTKPLVLSIVPHTSGAGAKVFLTQIISKGSINSSLEGNFLIFASEFTGEEATLSLTVPFSIFSLDISRAGPAYADYDFCIPTIVSRAVNGVETYQCAVGLWKESTSSSYDWNLVALEWAFGSESATGIDAGIEIDDGSTRGWNMYQRVGYSKKNRGEAVSVSSSQYSGGGMWYSVGSAPGGLFQYSRSATSNLLQRATSYLPMNIVGSTMVVTGFRQDYVIWADITKSAMEKVSHNLPLPSAARTFVDAGAYLWGKDIYMLFVGTGLIFSRSLMEGSFGYLDTTSVLGTITQFGYLDYSQDEGTLYILGQDTANKVKAAKIVLNTLYDYANDGAWLPMIASDGVPAYIKAKEEA